MIQHQAYSYRDDPSVPPFPDDAPIIVYDGVCVLCGGAVDIVFRRDPNVRFLAAQSHVAQALYRHYGLNAADFETWLLLMDGRAYVKADATERLVRRWGGVWAVFAAAIRLTPRRFRGWLYDRIARNRFRIFGRRDQCETPSEERRARFIAWR